MLLSKKSPARQQLGVENLPGLKRVERHRRVVRLLIRSSEVPLQGILRAPSQRIQFLIRASMTSLGIT